jgi:predicted DNA-binding transcriptional regulator YafY
MVEKLTDRSINTHFQSAMMKIKSVLPDREKQYLSDLHNNIEVFYTQNNDFPNNFLSELQRALANKNTITIDYQSISKDEQTCNRIIEPMGLCFYSLGWHLIGFCRMRNEYRDFRVDRIIRLTVNNETNTESGNISVRDYFYNLSKSADLTEIVIRFDKQIATKLQTVKYYYGFIDEVVHGNQIEMTLLSNDLNYFARWLLMYADSAEIMKPQQLKDIFFKLIGDIRRKYDSPVSEMETDIAMVKI